MWWAQALLEKATAIDPNYGPGPRRAGHQPYVSAPHMGWTDMATAIPIAGARAALGRDPGRQRGPVGRITRWAAPICSGVASTTRWPNSRWRWRLKPELFAGPWLSRPDPWPIADTGEEANKAALHALRLSPARSVFRDLIGGHRFPTPSFIGGPLCRSDALFARSGSASAAISSAATRVLTAARRHERANRKSPRPALQGAATRAAEYFPGLARQRDADQTRLRQGRITWKVFAARGLE